MRATLRSAAASLTLLVAAPVCAQLSAAPSSVDFGGQSMSTTSSPVTVTLTNQGGASVTVSWIASGNMQFGVTHDCTTLAPAASCAVQVTFTPAASAGDLSATVAVAGQLTVASDAPGSPALVPLAGGAERSLVTHYYRAILRRSPDLPGKLYWTRESLRSRDLGGNPNETWYAMSSFFFASAEYAALGRDNTAFVTDLYATFFNRAPDSQGLAFWTDQLTSGLPREVAIAAFMFSPEFAAFTQGIFGAGGSRPEVDVVMDFYRGMLSRLADEAGFLTWAESLRSVQCGADTQAAARSQAGTIADLFASEHASRNRTDAQYVGDLYNAFLRRGGDLQGVQFWIDRLTSGATRAQVRSDFMDTPEFGGRLQAIVAAACLSHGAAGTLENFVNGHHLRFAIEKGSDGLPLVGYSDDMHGANRIVRCGNDACTSGNSIVEIPSSTSGVGVPPAIAVGGNGLPIVAFENTVHSPGLALYKCGNAACTSANTFSTWLGNSNLGSVIVVGPAGRPLVAFDSPDACCGAPAALTVSCTNDDCSLRTSTTVIPGMNGVYMRVGDVRFGLNGLPLVPAAHGGILKLVRCADADCAAVAEVRTLATNAAAARPALAIGADGFPVMVYSAFDMTNGGPVVRVAKCHDAGCLATLTFSTVIAYANSYTQAISMPADGLPIIVVDTGNVARVIKCGDASCSDGNTVTVLAGFGSQMRTPSVTLGANGLPIVVFGDVKGRVHVLACTNPACTAS